MPFIHQWGQGLQLKPTGLYIRLSAPPCSFALLSRFDVQARNLPNFLAH